MVGTVIVVPGKHTRIRSTAAAPPVPVRPPLPKNTAKPSLGGK